MKTHGLARSCLTAVLMLVLVVGLAGADAVRITSRDASADFQKMMDEAVQRMHQDMHVAITGNADRDFARMMIPHHQGAIDMALVELRFGKDARLKRLAQEIIVTQRQEIAVMHLALGDPMPPGSPTATQFSVPEGHHER